MGDFGSTIYERGRKPRLFASVSRVVLDRFLKGRTGSAHLEKVSRGDVLNLKDVFPREYQGGTDFEVPEFAFEPDSWSKAFMKGLMTFGKGGGFERKGVAELGVGTGANVALILSAFNPTKVFASDLNGECTKLAARNIVHAVPSARDKFVPIAGDQNLGRWINGISEGAIDVVYGCLPQVVKASEIDLHEGDNVAHYYDPAQYPSERHHLGLGLNESALRQIHPLLPQGGTVILNLSGRPGKEAALEQMFRDCGYEPKLLHEEVIEQHSGTSLATLAAVEAHNGHRFEFFTSNLGSLGSQITATDAEERRLAGVKVYHKIYVIAGVKT